ncbi:MAG TPA: hypothetical protein LFW21_01260 [Rickettsia endosymbiont of Pyrocoelia pectoralis]|nr:hypothetical protein [Rickettsia endosymbiont of Pyrocoelia pectoralis]
MIDKNRVVFNISGNKFTI